MRRTVEFATCGRCGRKGAHLREPYPTERRIIEAEGEFALRVIACRYCKGWTRHVAGTDWRHVAASFVPAPAKRDRPATRRVGVDEVVLHRQVRETGATVVVVHVGEGSQYEQERGWMTHCLSHGLVCFHPTRKLAEHHAPVPSGWCDDCRRIAEGRAPRITTGKVL